MDLLDLATTQHSVFARVQARDLGMTDRQIDWMVRTGRIVRVHPTVYRLRGVAPTWRQRLMAATLSNPGTLGSHRGAACLRGLRGFERAPIEVVAERWLRRPRGHEGVILHETKDLVAADIDVVDGIPCTSLIRTLVDLPAVVHEFKAGVALDHASRLEDGVLARVHARHLEVARRGRNGTVKLRALLEERGHGEHKVDSGFERKALQLIAGSSLPRPVTQLKVEGDGLVAYLDIAWPDQLVAMECDSLEHHLGEAAFRWERARRRMLISRGWTVLEFTYREVTQQSGLVLRELHRHLAP